MASSQRRTGIFGVGALLQGVKKRYVLWREYLRFRIHFGFLGTPCDTSKGDVVLVSFSDWVPRLRMEGIMAAALRNAGYKPIVIKQKTHAWADRYFRACGVRDFLYLDEHVEAAKAEMSDEKALGILQEHQSFPALYDYTFQGIGVGRHVLSTIVRQRLQGSVGFGDQETQETLHRVFPASLRNAIVAEKIFSALHPAAVLFLEKGYSPYGELFDEAIQRGLNVIQHHNGHRSDLIILKRYSLTNRFQHSHSLSGESWRRVQAMPWSKQRDAAFMRELERAYAEGTWFNRKKMLEGKRIKTPEEVRAQLHLDPAKKTVVVFSHILWDATFFFGTNLFEDYEQWLIATVRAACDNPRLNWVVKLHPDYTWKMHGIGKEPRDVVALASGVGTLPPHIIVVPPETDISTYSFFGVMDYAVTVRGTIGIEAPCFGIPVLTAGTGRYSGLGFTEDSATPEEYLAKLAHIEDIPRLSDTQRVLARKHAHALFDLRPLKCTSFILEGTRTKDGKLENELRINLRSWKELQTAPDIQAFTQWVLHATDEDYLADMPS